MKNIRLFGAAALALAAVSCQKIEVTRIDPVPVNFIAGSIDTKTAFGPKDGDTYPTLWTDNDTRVKIALNYASSTNASVTPAPDYETAQFSASFTDTGAGSYTFQSLSPASAVLGVSSANSRWSFTIPTAQTPTAASVDEAAQILAATSETYDEFPETVLFNFNHVTAYGRMNITNLDLRDAEITSVSLTASRKWAGRWYYYPETGTVEANSASATITLSTSSTQDLWFACAPVDLGGGTVILTVNTTAGPFTKQINWPSGKAFESGKVFKFSVNMSGITASTTKTYAKVTDPSTLTVGSSVLIVADDYDYAVSTTQNGNNRAQAAVTKSGGSLILNPGAGVQVFTVKQGAVDGTIAFYDASQAGYIYAASSEGNQLKTKSALDENASFTVSISGGSTTVTAAGSNTRNELKYNDSAGVFSCYASGNQQKAVSIYKLEVSSSASDDPAETVTGWLELPAVTGDEDFVGTFYSTGSTGVGCDRNYSYYYNYEMYASLWTAYPLCSAHTSSGCTPKKDWAYNPDIAESRQVQIVDNAFGVMYGASDYARGHQIPNADRVCNLTMNNQTYYATNQTPQLQNKFNASIWSTLEGDVRTVAAATDTVYVVTGAAFRKVGGSETINYLTAVLTSTNPQRVPIPNYYWKVLLKVGRNSDGDVTSASAIGVWLPHEEYSSNDWSKYVVPVDRIEEWTGFDFFVNLPDSFESSAEANSDWNAFSAF